jgi:hypothetical protein
MARHEQFSVNELTVNKIFNPYGSNITPGANPTGAMDYFVDLNTSNSTADGLSWDTAFDTIAEAITASNASIGLAANRWWARRNRIFVLGDGITESLTVLPEKCDIIGCGSDLYPFPRVTGAHTIEVAKVGCRFINMGFQASGTGDLFVAPAACHGLSFLGCTFTSSAAGNTKALEITDCAHVRIEGCNFQPGAGVATTGLFALGIGIEGTASIHDLYIAGNRIFATAGIAIAAGDLNGSVVENNIIRCMGSGKACVDSSSEVAFINNRLMTAINDLAVASSCTWNAAIAVGNLLNTVQARNADIPIQVVMTS